LAVQGAQKRERKEKGDHGEVQKKNSLPKSVLNNPKKHSETSRGGIPRGEYLSNPLEEKERRKWGSRGEGIRR